MFYRLLAACVAIALPMTALAEPRTNYIADWNNDWADDLGEGWKLSGQLTAATDSTSKGISETQGNGQLSGNITLSRQWFYTAARLKNVKGSDGSDSQSALAIGGKWALGEVRLNSQLIYKVNNGARPGSDNHFVEWQTEVSRTWGDTTLKGLAIWTPDSSGANEQAGYYEVDLEHDLTDQWAVSGGVGIRRLQPARNYTAWNLGATYALTDTTELDLRYYDTDRHEYSKAHGDRLVLALTQKF